MIIKLLIDGGDMKPGPAVGQKLGPLGINIGKVVQDVNQATKDFKGIKVPVELNIKKDKTFSVNVLSPPTIELLKKEVGIEKASGEQGKIKVANAAIEQIISVAKTKHPNMLATKFKSAVKSVVGSCVSAGILIENKPAKEIEKEIDDGKYDKEIESMKVTIEPEKKKKLEDYFAEIKSEQEEVLKKEEEEKAAAEAKKAEVAEAEEGEEKKEEVAETGEEPEAGKGKPEEKGTEKK
jgi:large subunit ribosomal protein L11